MKKRSDNFKGTPNQFLYGEKQLIPDIVMNTLWNEIHNRDNILSNYTIHLTIPISECILRGGGGVLYDLTLRDNNFWISHRIETRRAR